MPVNQSGDFILNGKPYMLARGQFKGRAWKRTGLPNAVRPRLTDSDLQRNALPAEVDFVATYDDFSGGYGDAYRDPTTPTRIHWAENMEVRFPRQAIHCQEILPIEDFWGTLNSPSGGFEVAHNYGANWIMQVPASVDAAALAPPGPTGRGSVLISGRPDFDEKYGYLATYTPTGLPGNFVNELPLSRVLDVGPDTTPSVAMTAFYGRGALFGSYAWLGGDPASSMPYFRRRDLRGLAGISATIAPMAGAMFAVAGNAMWRAHGPSGGHVNLLQRVGVGLDPMATANWGATFNIGNGLVDVQDMVALDDQLFVSTQDGLYAGDVSATFYNVLGDISGQTHPDNGRNITVHERGIVYPYTGGLVLYQQFETQAVARDISPTQASQRSPLKGRVRAVTSYGGWLYAGLFTGSSSYLLAGRNNGNGAYNWNPLQRLPVLNAIPANAVRQITVDSISTPSGGGIVASGNAQLPPRFWVATEVSLGPFPAQGQIMWWPVPPGDTNPLGALNFSANYVGSARMDFGRDNRGAPETLKVLRRIDVNTDASTFLSGTRYADVYYLLDGGGRTLLGRAQQSPRTTLFFPSSTGSFTTCYDFELSVDSFTGSGGLTPIYRSFVLHGAFLSEGSDEISAVVRVADNVRDRHGAPLRPAATLMSELRTLAGSVPVQLIDLTGAANWVTVQRDIEENENYQQGADNPEIAATVKMAVLSFSSG